jgi:hypothetical protein
MGKVVALRILKRQLDMLQMGIIRHRHRQTRAGKVALFIEAQIVFDNRRLGAALQLKMMAIVRGVEVIARTPRVICISSSGFAGRWLRFTRIRVTVCARLSVRCRNTSGCTASGNP